MSELPASLKDDPSLLPIRLEMDEGTIQFARLSRDDYAAATFLREDSMPSGAHHMTFPIAEVEQAVGLKPAPLAFVAHAAFCGSTLLTRALEQTHQCYAVREPRALDHALSAMKREDDGSVEPLRLVLTLLSRRFAADEPALIKLNDLVNRSVETLLAEVPRARVLFLYPAARSFIAFALKRPRWVGARAEAVAPELETEGAGASPSEMSPGEQAALLWYRNARLYLRWRETTAGERVAAIRSERFLHEPAGALEDIGRLFGFSPRPQAAGLDAVLGRHAKGRRSYGRFDREKELFALELTQEQEIERGMKWLERMCPEQILSEPLPGSIGEAAG